MTVSDHTKSVADRAKTIYAEQLRTQLESDELNRYVAIEPESQEHFVADSFSKAVEAARAAHPDRISFVIHIGHEAAIHIGGING